MTTEFRLKLLEIIGELSDDISEYMLLCASANRAKSWSCENCKNWKLKETEVCRNCYWAFPESYSHIAMRDIRRLDLLWSGEEIAQYEVLKKEAARVNEEMPEYVKNTLGIHLWQKDS